MRFPRYVDTDLNVLVTRSTVDQRFFFAPNDELNQLFGYLLAVMSERFNLEVHAATVMADHWHMSVTDRGATLPRAIQWFSSLSARAANRYRDRSGTIYCPVAGPDYRYPTCELSVLDRVTYTMTNPVRHGAVRNTRQYPGFVALPEWYVDPPTFERPTGFFRDGGGMPERATLRLTVPDEYSHLERAEFVALLNQEVAARERALHATHAVEGLRYQGPRRCLKLDWRASAKKRHPRGASRGSEVISRDERRGQAFRSTLKHFRRAYYEARAQWLDGDRRVTWPQGTWLMRRAHAVAVAGSPPPSTS